MRFLPAPTDAMASTAHLSPPFNATRAASPQNAAIHWVSDLSEGSIALT